jgi:hypothetical protein
MKATSIDEGGTAYNRCKRRNVMKTIGQTRSFACALLMLGAMFATMAADASALDSSPSYLQPKVIAHLPLSGGARQMFFQQDGTREYLYVQQPRQHGFTVIDVTRADQPMVINQMSRGTLTLVGSGLAITETRANASALTAPSAAATRADSAGPASVRVLDVSDPAHLRTVRVFDGVTSILQDPARNLVYLSDGSGVWIVSHPQVFHRHECGSSDALSAMPNCN